MEKINLDKIKMPGYEKTKFSKRKVTRLALPFRIGVTIDRAYRRTSKLCRLFTRNRRRGI